MTPAERKEYDEWATIAAQCSASLKIATAKMKQLEGRGNPSSARKGKTALEAEQMAGILAKRQKNLQRSIQRTKAKNKAA